MDLILNEQNKTAIIEPSGDLVDPHATALFREKIYDAVNAGMGNIIVNMLNVKFINSIGIAALIGGYTTVKNTGAELKLANISPKVKSVLGVTKLDQVFHTYNSLDEASNSIW